MSRDFITLVNRVFSPVNKSRYNYELVSKNSASPTLIILTNIPIIGNERSCPSNLDRYNGLIAIKSWLKIGHLSHEEKALDYENKIYLNKIKPILDRDPIQPLLQYIGDDNDCCTVDTLCRLLCTNEDSRDALLVAFYIMKHINDQDFGFNVFAGEQKMFNANFYNSLYNHYNYHFIFYHHSYYII